MLSTAWPRISLAAILICQKYRLAYHMLPSRPYEVNVIVNPEGDGRVSLTNGGKRTGQFTNLKDSSVCSWRDAYCKKYGDLKEKSRKQP